MRVETRSKIVGGLLWLGTASAAIRAIDVLSSLAILFFLSSEEIGLASLSWTVAVMIEACNGLGVGVALVQAETVTRKQLDSLYWFALGFGAVVTGAIVAASPLIAWAFDAPDLSPMVSVSALRLLLMAAGLIPLQLLSRELRFKQWAAVQTFAAGAAALTKVALAALGAGAWSMVIAHTAEGLFTLVLLYLISPFWPRLQFSFAAIRRFVSFGIKAAASTIIYHSYRNLDFVIVGKVFGMGVLGAYRVAFDIAMIPIMAVMDVVNRAALPIYARVQEEDASHLRETFLWMVRSLMLICGPVGVVLYFAGADIVQLVVGDKWAASAPYIAFLCWAALLRALDQLFPPLFHAAARPMLAAWDSALTMAVFLALSPVFVALFGATLGANAVSGVWIAAYSVMVLVLRRWARGVIGLSFVDYIKNLFHPAVLTTTILVTGFLFELIPVVARSPLLQAAGHVTIALGLVLAYYRFVLGVTASTLIPRQGGAGQGDV